MAKGITRTQRKRLLESIKSKARKLWDNPGYGAQIPFRTADMIAIEKICDKYLKQFRG